MTIRQWHLTRGGHVDGGAGTLDGAAGHRAAEPVPGGLAG